VSVLTLKFDANLPFQQEAVQSVVDLFAGQPPETSIQQLMLASESAQPSLGLTDLSIANHLVISPVRLLENRITVQRRNGIEPERSPVTGRDYSIEMETGTGKTYVYLRTAFELNRVYGYRKFIIVVPSIAIREGVLHSIEIMRDHFRSLYNTPFDSFVYDSKQLNRIGQFARNDTMQLMVINIQAFQRDQADQGNVIYRPNDRMNSYRPIDLLQSTNPIVIIDEPQSSASGEASAKAIDRLNPLVTLRYSATYDDCPKLYQLGPIEAFQQKLVKGIAVLSIQEAAPNLNEAYVRLLSVDGRKGAAQIEINIDRGVVDTRARITVRPGANLFSLSNRRQEYENNYTVAHISFRPGEELIEFDNGVEVRLGQETGGLLDEVMRQQVRWTIAEHLDREKLLRAKGIKVLSLFFIDKVANYRQYNEDGSYSLGKIGRWFEEEVQDLIKSPKYQGLITDSVESIHDGYFAQDRKGQYRDSVTGRSAEDERAYELIMRRKEELLSLDEPLRFIFSHSALREGWDNPNVFQICTLNETRSVMKKRQEIGRGLRLPVNQHGERIHDEQINRLTVIANESYRSFAESLQREYEEDLKIEFGVVKPNAFAHLEIEENGWTVRLGPERSQALRKYLQQRGYLSETGRVEEAFAPDRPDFVLDVPSDLVSVRSQIVDVISQRQIKRQIVNAREKRSIAVNKHVLLDPQFKEMWEKVAQRTRYRVEFDTDHLVHVAAQRLRAAKDEIKPLHISIDRGEVIPTETGVGVEDHGARYVAVNREFPIPDILGYLQNEAQLTRKTLARILIDSNTLERLRVNPQAYVTKVGEVIKSVLDEILVTGIRYERADEHWNQELLSASTGEELQRYLDHLYEIRSPDKSPHGAIVWESQVEREFAEQLDSSDRVRFFVKLPDWFKVDTPVGTYNPDWAVRLADPETLVFVRETKSTTVSEDRRVRENRKIECAKHHFAAIDVNYGVATSIDDVWRSIDLG
jgi:type III restriction enzyme